MKTNRLRNSVFALFAVGALCSVAFAGDARLYKLGPLPTAENEQRSEVLVLLSDRVVEFEVQDYRMAAVHIETRNARQEVVFDSGVQYGPGLLWDTGAIDREREPGPYPYTLTVWDAQNQVVRQKLGELSLADPDSDVSMAFTEPGDFTIGGYLGAGTDPPQRA